MKKRILFFCILAASGFCFIPQVKAKAFQEVQNKSYKMDLFIPSRSTHLVKDFVKITDESGLPFYEVTPKRSFFSERDDYVLKEASLDIELLEKLSKIMYFGYGYNGNTTDAYFLATQYLIYEAFDDLVLTKKFEEGFIEKEMEEIEKNIQNVSFSLQDFSTTKKTYSIADKYIVDNFIVKGDKIKVIYEKEKIIIDFLEEGTYDLQFQPKNQCQEVQVWTAVGIELLNMTEVCEKEYTVSVQVLKEEGKEEIEEIEKPDAKVPENNEEEKKEPPLQEEDFPITEETPEEKEENYQDVEIANKNEKVEEIQEIEDIESSLEVSVPNTHKYSWKFLAIFLWLGNIYYVYKK